MLFSLNSERTFDNILNNTPEDIGPGVYNITPVMGNKKKMKAPFGAKSERSIFPKQPTDAPSPGEYEPKPLNSGLSITSVFVSETRRKTFSTDSNPDPTKYSHVEGWCSSSLSQNATKKQKRILPKPKIVTGYIGQSDVTCYVSNEKGEWVPNKKKAKTSADLGPGTYYNSNSKYNASKALPISLGHGAQRNIFKVTESFPGPGAYSPQIGSNKIPIKISATNRESKSAKPSTEPGPNYLDLKEWAEPEYEGTSCFKNRELRAIFQPSQQTPAPTAYYRPPRQYLSSGDGFGSRAERFSLSALNTNPGPGTYEPRMRWINKNRAFSLKKSTGHSTSLDSKNSNDVPGPGNYATSDPWVKENLKPSAVFESRTQRAEDVISDTPGAGSYNPRIADHDHAVPTLIRESRFEDQSSWVDKSQIENPSPDFYQNIQSKPGKGITISSTNRDIVNRNQNPGPGTYNVVHSSMKTKCYNARVPKDNDE